MGRDGIPQGRQVSLGDASPSPTTAGGQRSMSGVKFQVRGQKSSDITVNGQGRRCRGPTWDTQVDN